MSIVFGYIICRDYSMQANLQAISRFDFDEKYPFTNIFWGDSPAQYFLPTIGFTGSYKSLEEDWEEWLWKFTQLLSRLESIEAHVNLHGLWGNFSYDLKPKSYISHIDKPHEKPYPEIVKGDEWVITSAPEWDFSLRPDLLEQYPNRWNKFVKRWKMQR